jgi:nucleotidyltransferase/DNA polymerase involved in DNA repair
VSLALFRNESKKIFEILNRYSSCVEKASCDEAFIDVTAEVNQRYQSDSDQNNYPDSKCSDLVSAW